VPFQRSRYPRTLGLLCSHLVACGLFLLFRTPVPAEWQATLDRERAEARTRTGMSMSMTDAYLGHVACRQLRSWSTWHGGGEALGVKALEVLNLPAAVPTVITAALVDDSLLHYRLSFCRSSWLDAGIFLFFSSIQWLVVGLLWDARSRSRRVAGV
jgi:hypothetical protein